MSTVEHSSQGMSLTGAVRSGRRHRPVRRAPAAARMTHPKACTTSTAVDEHALAPAMTIQSRAQRLCRVLEALDKHSTDLERCLLHEGLREAAAIASTAAGMASWLDGPVAALKYSEDLCDWDALADLCAFKSGRRIASELIPLLDVIRSHDRMPDFAAIARARTRLDEWFDAHGEALLRPVVLAEVSGLRAPTLQREFERWRSV